jgi:hypothetical protein
MSNSYQRLDQQLCSNAYLQIVQVTDWCRDGVQNANAVYQTSFGTLGADELQHAVRSQCAIRAGFDNRCAQCSPQSPTCVFCVSKESSNQLCSVHSTDQS